MRKILCLSLVALLATPFAACGDDGGTTTTDTLGGDTTVSDTTTTTDTSTNTDTMVEGDTNVTGDTLVADTNVDTDTTVADTNVQTCQDDNVAGTAAAPADLVAVLANDPTFHICPGVNDVFQFTANAGDIVKINLITDVTDLSADTTPGVDDIDMYLYAGSIDDANEISGGSAATAAAIEQIVVTVDTTGTYYLVVEDYDGSAVDYFLTFSTATGCAKDADCGGSDICYVGIDDENFVIAQECRAYTAPACGQGTAEDSTSSHSDGTAVAFSSIATNGSFTGSICGDDVDVYKFDLAAGDSLLGSLNATLTGNAIMLGTFVDADGNIAADAIVLDAETASGDFNSLFVASAGTYFLYVDYLTDGSATADVAYTVNAQVASACKLDADCSGGTVCGMFTPSGPVAVCVPEPADVCGSDNDNSQTHATALTSGTAVTTEVVCDTGNDWYKVTVDATSDISVTVTWTGEADLDVYFLSADGTPYGAGWYGDGSETVGGKNLPAGTYYFLVDQYTTDGSGTAGVAYSITATATASAANCASDAACLAGGALSDDGDPTVDLVCNTTSGICEPPVSAGIGAVAPGAACFDAAGIAAAGQCSMGGFCLVGTCTTECGVQADCDSNFGGSGVAYCQDGSLFGVSFNFCIPNCDSPTASTHLWSDAECSSLGFSGCDGTSNQCAE
ncbi:MAG: hypothetical protein EP329_06365 [Deltaproteobacteria bacterium]|nr:MAG: hypothetical protein EP329_06365 [Deltaproteobacteria bacterium]